MSDHNNASVQTCGVTWKIYMSVICVEEDGQPYVGETCECQVIKYEWEGQCECLGLCRRKYMVLFVLKRQLLLQKKSYE